MQRKPEFFIVGAPKCGTTSMYEYLKAHPDIYLPRRKELLFFCDDLHFSFPILREDQFMKYYEGWKGEKKAGEVSVWNLYSATAARNILKFNPAARIIIILRQPAEMLHALHENLVFSANETATDFEAALRLQQERKKGRFLPRNMRSPQEALFYYDVASYPLQVSRYLELFGPDRVHLILFDDLLTDIHSVFRKLLEFIGVDPSFVPDFRVYNTSKTARSAFIRKLTVDSPGWLKETGRILFPHQSRARDWVMKFLWKINSQKSTRAPMPAHLHDEITGYFRSDIHALQRLTGRDLSSWLGR